MTRSALVAVSVLAAVVLAGCTAPQPTPTPTPTPTAVAEPSGDGVLRVGTLLPMTGDVAFIGPAMVAAVEVAVREINAAGGVLGQPVEALYRDSGDASQELLETAFADLVDRGVDVVIGPATSALAERLVPLAAEAGVTVISPAATFSTARVGAPEGVFFRTIVGYEQQAAAIVSALAEQGDESVALVTTGDALGFSFELATRAALEREGLRLQSIEQLDAATNTARLAFSVTAGEPDAIILATGSTLTVQNGALIAALADRDVAADRLWFTAQNMADYSTTVEAGLLEGANGVLEGAVADDAFIAQLRQSDPALLSFRYAPETYDAVLLAALAAELAGDDGGASIAAFLSQASADGVPCSSFGECLEVLQTEPAIDYEGLSGAVTIDAVGDVIDGEVGLYRYSADNRPERVGALALSAR